MSTIEFFREGLKNLKTVGTVTRSSKFLCKGVIRHIDFKKADLIVEIGAGDGVITRHILKKMKPNARLLAFEVNPRFCDLMRKIDDERLIVVEDSAEHLGIYIEKLGAREADYIVSAIPFVALPKDLALEIIRTCHRYLKEGGLFLQVHYSLLAKNFYETVFGNVDINFVPLNVPPAFVLVSEKRKT